MNVQESGKARRGAVEYRLEGEFDDGGSSQRLADPLCNGHPAPAGRRLNLQV